MKEYLDQELLLLINNLTKLRNICVQYGIAKHLDGNKYNNFLSILGQLENSIITLDDKNKFADLKRCVAMLFHSDSADIKKTLQSQGKAIDADNLVAEISECYAYINGALDDLKKYMPVQASEYYFDMREHQVKKPKPLKRSNQEQRQSRGASAPHGRYSTPNYNQGFSGKDSQYAGSARRAKTERPSSSTKEKSQFAGVKENEEKVGKFRLAIIKFTKTPSSAEEYKALLCIFEREIENNSKKLFKNAQLLKKVNAAFDKWRSEKQNFFVTSVDKEYAKIWRKMHIRRDNIVSELAASNKNLAFIMSYYENEIRLEYDLMIEDKKRAIRLKNAFGKPEFTRIAERSNVTPDELFNELISLSRFITLDRNGKLYDEALMTAAARIPETCDLVEEINKLERELQNISAEISEFKKHGREDLHKKYKILYKEKEDKYNSEVARLNSIIKKSKFVSDGLVSKMEKLKDKYGPIYSEAINENNRQR